MPPRRAAPPPPAAPSTRDRLVAAMVEALRRRGLHGIGLNELLAHAAAPKGVLYHHFPDGKTALAVAAIEATVNSIAASLAQLSPVDARPNPVVLVEGLRRWFRQAEQQLVASGFERGCPLATVALESTGSDLELRRALAAGFARLRAELAAALACQGVAKGEAQALATLVVAGYEGALMQARVAASAATMRLTTDGLLSLVQAALDRSRTPPESSP